VLFRERNIDVWKKKLDWVAAHGGMALLNTHPDYMAFDGKPAGDEYPASYYEEFLRYVREKYDGLFWAATPREVARYYCAAVPASSRNTRKKVCMLVYSHYETDSRVRRYAEALARRGDRVEVIALAGGHNSLGRTTLNGVDVYRIQRREADERSKWTYALRQARFFFASSVIPDTAPARSALRPGSRAQHPRLPGLRGLATRNGMAPSSSSIFTTSCRSCSKTSSAPGVIASISSS
jgi:hypothetical protein